MTRTKFVLLLIAGGLVAAAFGTGLLSWSRVRSRVASEGYRLEAKARGLANAGQPTAADLQAAEICRQNLRRIESAKRAIATRSGVNVGTISWDAVLREMGGQRPVCPRGGVYTLGTLERLPRCSIETNNTPSPADDHKINAY